MIKNNFKIKKAVQKVCVDTFLSSYVENCHSEGACILSFRRSLRVLVPIYR